MVTIIGFPGLTSWPKTPFVSHEVPLGDVQIFSKLFKGSMGRLTATASDGSSEEFVSFENTIFVPADVFNDALVKRLILRLFVAGNESGGYIIMLPVQESETFSLGSAIKPDGSLVNASATKSTRLVSVVGVTDMVLTATQSSYNYLVMAAYDADGNFIRSLVGNGSYDNLHVVPDGSYTFIRASGSNDSPRSLIMYFEE